jgi:hypothetical protein
VHVSALHPAGVGLIDERLRWGYPARADLVLRFGLEIGGFMAHFKQPRIFGATTRST